MRRTPLPIAFLAALGAAACTGDEEPPDPDPPTIAMLAPEPGDVRVRENLAIAGEATGALTRVEIRLDAQEPVEATGLDEWFHLLDVSSLPDGSHTVAAIATDEEDRTAETIPVSFTSIANQPPGTAIWSGLVRDSDQVPLAGATVSVFGDTRSTTADLNGRYAMVGLPPEETLLVASAAGYVDTYMLRFAAIGDANLDIPMFSDTALDFVAGEYGVTRQSGLGTVIGFLLDAFPDDSGYAGAVLALDGSTGDGPFYTSATGVFDPALTETSSSGVFLFFNVSTGPVAVTASDAGVQFNLFGSELAPDSVAFLFGRAQ